MKKQVFALPTLIELYQVFDKSEGRSPMTITWHQETLRQFLKWLEANGRPTQLDRIGITEAREFILFYAKNNGGAGH
jgi:hypothetical protein